MTLIEQQFHQLSDKHPGATCTPLGNGSYVIAVPNFPLPTGWTLNVTTVRFIAPVGFPVARPDCFWTDPGLMLAGNRVPQNTGSNPIPGGPAPILWFSWHVKDWSPNSDTLLTYLRVIEKRFREMR